MNPKIAEVVALLERINTHLGVGVVPQIGYRSTHTRLAIEIYETIEKLQAVAQHGAVVVDEAMVERACEAYADMYDVEYINGGQQDNRRACIRAALTAALASGEGK